MLALSLALSSSAVPTKPDGPPAPKVDAPPPPPPQQDEDEEDYMNDEDYMDEEDFMEEEGDYEDEDFTIYDEDDLNQSGSEDEIYMLDDEGEPIETPESNLAAEILEYTDTLEYCQSLEIGKPDPWYPENEVTQKVIDECFDDLNNMRSEIKTDSEALFKDPVPTPKPESSTGWMGKLLHL